MKIKQLVQFLDKRYNVDVCDEIDYGKLGLQIGDLDVELTSVLLTLDVTNDVVDEAIKLGSNLIISHHPVIFNPMLRFTEQSKSSKLLRKLIQSNISVYNMHTNLDLAVGGVNDALADAFGLINTKTIDTGTPLENYIRYGTIIPSTLKDYANKLKEVCNIPVVKVLGNLEKEVKSVAILGGAGSDVMYQNQAILLQVDVYVTSEIKHHEAMYANLAGLAMIEIPHSAEFFYHTNVSKELAEFGVLVFVTKTKTDPFTYL